MEVLDFTDRSRTNEAENYGRKDQETASAKGHLRAFGKSARYTSETTPALRGCVGKEIEPLLQGQQAEGNEG